MASDEIFKTWSKVKQKQIHFCSFRNTQRVDMSRQLVYLAKEKLTVGTLWWKKSYNNWILFIAAKNEMWRKAKARHLSVCVCVVWLNECYISMQPCHVVKFNNRYISLLNENYIYVIQVFFFIPLVLIFLSFFIFVLLLVLKKKKKYKRKKPIHFFYFTQWIMN